MSISIEQFKQQHKNFFWWMRDLSQIDDSGLMEATLTYGNMKDRKELVEIFGRPYAQKIFSELAQSRRAKNLEPRTLHYWKLYLR